MPKKPIKKTDKELFGLIETKIRRGEYVFLKHAKQRLKERNISDIDVVKLLLGTKGYQRKRNKKKDAFEHPSISELAQDWKYCIEGTDVHGNNLRVIVTFNENLMPIITVIKI